MKEICFTTRAQWRKWLARNHGKEPGVWLVFYKKHTGRKSLDYDAAVEEALCFGWIDSLVKKLDEQRYARKLTPRKAGSHWSAANTKRARKLMQEGLMTNVGLAKVDEAKRSGLWSQPSGPQVPTALPEELEAALEKNRKAKAAFAELAPTYRNHYLGWIAAAKRPETRARRVREAVALLTQGKKLGLK